MPVTPVPGSRRGSTLAELLVGLTLLGIIGSAAVSAMRLLTGVRSRVALRAAAAVQVREAVAPLVGELASASPAGGDIPPGAARDSTLELRATMATGHVCALPAGMSRIAWAAFPAVPHRPPAPGDSLWLYVGVGLWRVTTIEGAVRATPSPAGCVDPGFAPPLRLELDSATRALLPLGATLRVTRRVRYSFYRSADGLTYLGLREWSHTTNSFATVQPVAGPFVRGESRFVYHDTAGAELPSGSLRSHAIGAISVRLVPAGREGGPARPGEPVLVRAALRNR